MLRTRSLFEAVLQIAEGLGPLYNAPIVPGVPPVSASGGLSQFFELQKGQ